MRRRVRPLAVAAAALVVPAAAWLRLEQPVAPLGRVVALLALALAPAVPSRWRWRAPAALVATVAGARLAVSLVPYRPSSYSALATRLGTGFSDFYGTHLPFDPRVHVAMGDLVLAAIFLFSLLLALFASARKPVGSAIALLVGAGWPATLLGPSYGLAMGALILGGVLVLLAGLGSRRVPALALPAVVVVATAAVAVGSATAARHGLVNWQAWNLTHTAGGPGDVGFVWDAQYGGLDWSGRPTVVLQVRSEHTPSFLRAAVLDDFVGDAWAIGVPRPADALEPAAAFRPGNEIRQTVTVESLADSHLVGGSVPVRFAAGAAPLVQPERGLASLPEDLPSGFSYSVWSYTPRPTARDLRRSPPQYPSVLADEGLLDVGDSVTMPPFGTRHHAAAVLSLVAQHPGLNPYLPLARLAEQVAGGARTPYDAVTRLENWFVGSGRFRYSNHPPVISPPLVAFVTETRTGYCQYFAGAMALMLRYLGIPARVAVGFAGGTYSPRGHAWLVSDREAHAWVEVWFKGYGWLPFDPTPVAPGSAPRPVTAGAGVAGAGRGPEPGFRKGRTARKGSDSIREANAINRENGFVSPHGRATAPASAESSGGSRGRVALLLLLVLAAAGGGIVLAKAGIRLLRRTHRDPRHVAAACRAELASFLVDQRIEAPHSATLRELGELVEHEFGVDPDAFVAAASAARFGPATQAAAAVSTARRELRVLLDGARRGLTWRERLRGLLSLRSLARHAATVDASASLSGGMV